MQKKVNEKIILLVSHESGTPGGPVEKLKNFLYKKKFKIYTVYHPLFPSSSVKSQISLRKRVFEFKLPGKIQYFLEGFITAFLFFNQKYKKQIYLAICFDPLSYFNTYLFKKMLGVKKIAYYNLDFSVRRFNNPIYNKFYRFLNSFAYSNCDYFFCLRKGVTKLFDPHGKQSSKVFIIGQTVSSIKIRNLKKIDNSLVYAGAIGPSVDFDPLLNALRRLDSSGSNFILDIFGAENDNGKLRNLIKNYDLSRYIRINKPVPIEKIINHVLPRYYAALAPYAKKGDKNTPDYVFQGNFIAAKIVDYVSVGLPVIATRINSAFDDITKLKFGFLANNTDDWYKYIRRLLFNKKINNLYSRNAKSYSTKFDENKVFKPILDILNSGGL